MLLLTRARTPARLHRYFSFCARFFQDGDVKVGVFPESVAAADATNHTGEDACAYIAIDETFVEDLVRGGAVVNAAMWFTSDARARSRSVGLGHFQAPGYREGSSKSVAAADATNHTGEDARAYIAIFVSRTRLSLLSEWGCQGRRLSRECSSSRFY